MPPAATRPPPAYGPPVADSWDPVAYHRFRSSHSAPFHDLVARPYFYAFPRIRFAARFG